MRFTPCEFSVAFAGMLLLNRKRFNYEPIGELLRGVAADHPAMTDVFVGEPIGVR